VRSNGMMDVLIWFIGYFFTCGFIFNRYEDTHRWFGLLVIIITALAAWPLYLGLIWDDKK
jgi:hypothetical protein